VKLRREGLTLLGGEHVRGEDPLVRRLGGHRSA
jgi:hypothetical protein